MQFAYPTCGQISPLLNNSEFTTSLGLHDQGDLKVMTVFFFFFSFSSGTNDAIK